MHRRKHLAFLVGILVLAPALRAETWTIATYNVENYVATNRMTEAGYRQDYPKPEAQKRALRAVLAGLGADVLVLQEMGGAEYLAELQRDLKKAGLDYPNTVLLEADDADRHVALLSKRPIQAITKHTELEFAYFGKAERVKRGLLEVHFATPAGDLIIFGVHLKSRFTERADDARSGLRRSGEAEAIRDAILRRCADPAVARFIVLGDFNDDKASKPVQRLLRRGKTPVSKLLPAADSRGETWTHAYAKEDSYTRVDHILFSPALSAAAGKCVAKIYDGEGVRDASDHRPVVVSFDLTAK